MNVRFTEELWDHKRSLLSLSEYRDLAHPWDPEAAGRFRTFQTQGLSLRLGRKQGRRHPGHVPGGLQKLAGTRGPKGGM